MNFFKEIGNDPLKSDLNKSIQHNQDRVLDRPNGKVGTMAR